MQPSSGFRVEATIAGAGIDEPLEHFVGDFNSYIDDYNKLSRRQNEWQAIGYLAAAISALISMILSLGMNVL